MTSYGYNGPRRIIQIPRNKILESCREKGDGETVKTVIHVSFCFQFVKSFVILALISTLIADPQDLFLTSSPPSLHFCLSQAFHLPSSTAFLFLRLHWSSEACLRRWACSEWVLKHPNRRDLQNPQINRHPHPDPRPLLYLPISPWLNSSKGFLPLSLSLPIETPTRSPLTTWRKLSSPFPRKLFLCSSIASTTPLLTRNPLWRKSHCGF